MPFFMSMAVLSSAKVQEQPPSPMTLISSNMSFESRTTAGRGLTNREVAQVTYMSAKTVEAHLASVYRKLGIRSRAELGARMAALVHQEPRETPDSVAEPAP